MDETKEVQRQPRYRWPWVLLGFVIFGLVLAVLWMSVLVHRIHEERQYNMWGTPVQSVPNTNSAPAKTNSVPAKTNPISSVTDTHPR